MPLLKVTVRGVDRGWTMGRDVPMEVDSSLRFNAFFHLIASTKDIPKSRMVVKLPAAAAGAASTPDELRNPQKQFEWDRGRVGGKGDWTVRRCGIFSGVIVLVEPCFPLAWLWEERQWYEDAFIDTIAEAVRTSDEKKLTLQELSMQAAKPPPLYMTLRAFLRKYPEVIRQFAVHRCSIIQLATPSLFPGVSTRSESE